MKRVDPPQGSWLVTTGSLDYRDGKAPTQEFGGWGKTAVPGGKQAMWVHGGTTDIGDHVLGDVADELEEKGLTAFLLDIAGANLGLLDFDLEDDPGEVDRAEGKWGDEDAMHEYVRETFPDCTIWHSQSGGLQVPVLYTDEAYESVFSNEWQPGFGVDSLKGPASKGYTAAPLSPGYGLEESGDGWPLLGLNDLDRMDCFKSSETGGSTSVPDDFEPTITREEAASLETTSDIEEAFSAVRHLGPSDLKLKSSVKGERPDGDIGIDPSWRPSDSGVSLAYRPDEGIFWDWSDSKGGYADKLIAIEEGIITSFHDELTGSDWWEAYEELQRRGAPVPEYEGDTSPTPGIIAPYTPVNRADPTVDPLPQMDLSDVRGQTRNIVSEAIELGSDTVVRIPPAGGKTHSAMKEIAGRGLPSNYACGTHRNANEACELLEEEGFTDYDLPPSASRTGLDQDGDDLEHLNDTSCPTFMGDHGEAERERMHKLVEGADGSTRLVHKIAESDDSDIEMFPCQEGDDECNYVEAWDRWNPDASVQVCHYTHLKMDGLQTVGDNGPERVNFIDEFPAGAFETHWTGSDDDERSISKLRDDVMAWLGRFGPRPAASGEDVWDALENETARDGALDGLRDARTLEDLRDTHVPWDAVDTRDIEGAIENGWHPATSLVAYLYAKSSRLENGFRWAEAGKFRLAVEPNGDVHLLRPPELSNGRQVVGLDATACEPMWRSVTGMDDLRAVDSMATKQKKAYYKHALNLDVVQVSDWMKSLAGVGNRGNEAFRADHAELVIDYLEHAADGGDTGLITSKQALSEMERSGVGLGRVDMTGYYGNFKGENRFGGVNVGAVFGSNHPGDREIQKWAAYRGENAQREERPEGDQSDWELDYQNETANDIFDYYLEGAVMQAVVRFSRNEERGLVVVYTDRIPDEVPVHKAGLTKFAESRGDVLEAIEAGADTLERAAARVHWSERTVRRAIEELAGAGAVERDADGRLRAKGPVSRVGSIGGDGCPIIHYRETVIRDDEVQGSDPGGTELLGVRALLMDVAGGDEGGESSVQTSISPTLGAD